MNRTEARKLVRRIYSFTSAKELLKAMKIVYPCTFREIADKNSDEV